jgi:hypothetical protein
MLPAAGKEAFSAGADASAMAAKILFYAPAPITKAADPSSCCRITFLESSIFLDKTIRPLLVTHQESHLNENCLSRCFAIWLMGEAIGSCADRLTVATIH